MLLRDHILMMPAGEGGGGGGGNTTPPPEAQANVNQRDAQKSLKDEAQATLDITNQFVQAQITSTEQLKTQQKIMQDISKSMDDAYSAQQEFLNQSQINITNFSSTFEKLSNDADAAANRGAMLRDTFKDLAKENNQLFEDLMDIAENTKLSADEAKASFEKLKGELQLAQGVGKNFDGATKDFAKSLGLAGKTGDTFAGKLFEVSMKLKKLNFESAKAELKRSFTNSLLESFGPMSLFTSFVEMAIESIKQFDAASKSLESSFGQFGAFQSELVANNAEIQRMGLNATDQAKVVTDLATGFARFTGETEANKRSLKLNNSALDALGVSTTNVNQVLDVMVVGMNKSSIEASNLTLKFAGMGKAFGKTSEQMLSDFASLSKSIVSYGDQMEEVFLGLQEQAKRTGISIGSLNTLAESFDKFTDSATKAAQLNSLFGTNLSAMGLNAMTADERIKELTQQLSPQLETMSRYQKIALKNALGLSSVAEAVQLLGGELSTAEKEEIKAAKAQEEFSETLRGLAKATLPLAKKLETLFTSLTSNEKTVDAMISVIRMFSKALVFLANKGHIAIPIMFGISAALRAMALGLAATQIASVGIIAAIAAVAGIMYLLSDAMHHERSPKFYLMFGVIAAGIIAIGLAAIFVQPGLATLAVVFLGVGLALSGIFYGMNMVVESLTGLFTIINEGGDSFPKAGAGLHLMATGMIALGAASLIATAGITAALTGIGAIAKLFSFGGDSIQDLVSAGEGMNKMGSGIEKFSSGLEKIKVVASELKNSLGDTLIAASMEGQKMSILVGKEASVSTLFKNDTLNIKVDMPEINIPTPKFDVYLDGQIIKAKIEQRYGD